MPERVAPVALRDDQVALGERVEGRLRRRAGEDREHTGLDRPSDDGAQLERAPLTLGKQVEPGEHRRLDRIRQRRVLPVLAVAPGELGGEERVALGALADALDRRRVGVRHEGANEGAGLSFVEGLEGNGHRVAARSAPGGAPVEELRPGERDHEEGGAGPRLDDLLDEVEEAVARPVEILEHEHREATRGEAFYRRAPGGEELLALADTDLGLETKGRTHERRDALGLGAVHAAIAETGGDSRHRQVIGRQLEEACEEPTHREIRDRRAEGQALRGRHAQVRMLRADPAGELLHETRLAGAGGRADGDELRPRFGERPRRRKGQLREVGPPPDECAARPPRRRIRDDRFEQRAGDRLGLPLHGHGARRREAEPRCGGGDGACADEDLAGRSRLLEPCGDVDRVPGDEEIPPRLARCDDLAGVEPDPQGERRRDWIGGHGFTEREGGAERAIGIVVVRLGDAEDRHDRVADELLDGPAAVTDHARGGGVIGGHDRPDVLGIAGVGERGRARDVGEQDRDDAALLHPRAMK